jgi:hypothetical protein
MTTHSVALDLRFPIGDFNYDGPFSEAQRAVLIEDIAMLAAKLRAAVAGLNEAQLDTPYRDEGWTVRQTVHHVADSHMHSYLRVRFALTEKNPTIAPYPENVWAELLDAKQVSFLIQAARAASTVATRSEAGEVRGEIGIGDGEAMKLSTVDFREPQV